MFYIVLRPDNEMNEDPVRSLYFSLTLFTSSTNFFRCVRNSLDARKTQAELLAHSSLLGRL